MAAIFVIVGLAILAGLIWRGWWFGETWSRSFATAESILAISGLIAGVAWYLIARPDEPKLKLEQNAQAFSTGDGRALITIELSLTNVGGRSLRLENVPYKTFVEQMTPLGALASSEYQPETSDRVPRKIYSGEPAQWAALAKGNGEIDSSIESQESENLYNRVVIPCSGNLTLYVSTWVYKPKSTLEKMRRSPQLAWVKQTTVDLGQICSKKARGNANEKGSNTGLSRSNIRRVH